MTRATARAAPPAEWPAETEGDLDTLDAAYDYRVTKVRKRR